MTQLSIDYDLSDRERRILSLIPEGRSNARPISDISLLTGLHEREVQQVVEGLIHNHDCFIGSSSGRPHGYYIMVDAAELEAVYRSLRRRGIRILRRASKLKRIALEEVFNQGRIELEEAL